MIASCARDSVLELEKEPFPVKEGVAETMCNDHNSYSLTLVHFEGENQEQS